MTSDHGKWIGKQKVTGILLTYVTLAEHFCVGQVLYNRIW